MEYKMTNVAKFIAFAVIATIIMDTVTAAPTASSEDKSSTATSKQPRNLAKNPRKHNHHQKKGQGHGKKNLMDKTSNLTTFDDMHKPSNINDEDVQKWKNACKAITSTTPKYRIEPNYTQSYADIKLSIQVLNTSFASMTTINTSKANVEQWEKYQGIKYTWLPAKPGGLAYRWHYDVQIYVASFTSLYKAQLEPENKNNNLTVSVELKDLRDRARELLCDIEGFINATSNQNSEMNNLFWIEKHEMVDKISFQKKQLYNNLFVKARFEKYIDRMYKRIKHFNMEKNLEVRSYKRRPKTTRKPGKHGKHAKGNGPTKTRRGRSTTLKYSGQPTSLPKTFIITTKRQRRNNTRRLPRSTRLPGSRNQNRINQSRHLAA